MEPEYIFYLILLVIALWGFIFATLNAKIEDRMHQKAIERAKKRAENEIEHQKFMQKCKEEHIMYMIKMEEELKKRPNDMFLKRIVAEAKYDLLKPSKE